MTRAAASVVGASFYAEQAYGQPAALAAARSEPFYGERGHGTRGMRMSGVLSVEVAVKSGEMQVSGCWWAVRIAGAVLLMLALAGCASAPVQQMSDARQAIAAAEQAGAARKAPAEIAEAKRYLHGAEQALEHRRFGLARENAIKARAAALSALDVSRRSDAAKDADESSHPPKNFL